MALADWLLASLVIVFGAVVQGVSGVGSGFIMVPLLALIDLRLLPGALIFGSMSISGLMAWIERPHISPRETRIVLIAILPGALIGSWLLSVIRTEQLGIFFGVMILLGVAISAFGVRLTPNLINSAIAGSVAGAMGAASGIGAPVVALLYQHWSGPELRATLAFLYTVASSIILLALALFGQFGPTQIGLGLLLVPGYLVGLAISRQFTTRIDRGNAQVAVLVVAALSALSLIAANL